MRLTVNGTRHDIDVPADTPLLWALRDELRLTGTKFGCGISQCGACTVHVAGTDGHPAAIRSCVTPMNTVAERAITTIEGLSADGSHPVQRAWIEEDVPQCGYCQAGFIMSAAALLARKPRANDAEIDAALAGHICRCHTYARIRAAVQRARSMTQESVTPAGRPGGEA